jgi:RNA polymerase sigma-70 factor (ECF subfamily)
MNQQVLLTTWIHEARSGNKSGFNNLITYYHAQLLSYALRICKFSNIAEDAIQDAYINAFIHISEVKNPENFFYWLRTIVKRSCLQYLNKNEGNLPLSSKLIGFKLIDNNLEAEIEKNNMNEFLWERISHLSETLRIVVLLRYFSEFGEYENISDILGIPIGTVKSRLNEAKKQLRKIWNYELSEMPNNIRIEANYWNEFYTQSFTYLQNNIWVRNKFINHFLPDISIRYTSSKTVRGRSFIEREIEEDIKFGISYDVHSVFNLKNTGILQAENINSIDYPDRCPPMTTFIFHRKSDVTHYLQLHNNKIYSEEKLAS